jgi:hypothetical protein
VFLNDGAIANIHIVTAFQLEILIDESIISGAEKRRA